MKLCLVEYDALLLLLLRRVSTMMFPAIFDAHK